jgi:hypothetical protein
MPRLTDRLDIASVTARVLKLPKGKKRGAGVGFCNGDPVLSVESSQAAPIVRWVDDAPQPVAFRDVRSICANVASASQIGGYWSTPKGDERALVWTVNGHGPTGVELHPADWEKSVVLGCGDGQQIGYGYKQYSKQPSRALWWNGTRESVVVLTGPDAGQDAMGHAVCDGVQAGHIGGSGFPHACLWRGSSESFVDLHPARPDINGSEIVGLDADQQVGFVWTKKSTNEAALWTGSAASYATLAPAGSVRSRAERCAHGFQIGWMGKEFRGMMLRAALWSGSADEFLDLQEFLPEPYNASWARDLHVEGNRLRIIGIAQKVVRDGYEMDDGKVPVMWDITLCETVAPRAARPASRHPASPIAPAAATPAAASAVESDDELVASVASVFAQAVVDGDYKAAHAQLAPWLQREIPVETLQSVLTREMIDGIEPIDFTTGGNDTTLQDLREGYAEYHEDDRSRTFSTCDSFGEYGQPSIYIADHITPENYRQWMSIDFTPEEDNEAGIDYCLRLWLIVVKIDGAMKIGHLEPSE